MLTLTVTTWSEGRGLSECGDQIDGTRHTTEDLDEITCQEEAEAAGIPTARGCETSTTSLVPPIEASPLHSFYSQLR
jgi:hypothetical protein